jgi:hypothetical protein
MVKFEHKKRTIALYLRTIEIFHFVAKLKTALTVSIGCDAMQPENTLEFIPPSSIQVKGHPISNKIAEFCQRWKIDELALFGSALRDDFRSDSDIDLLVTFAPDAKKGLFELAQMQTELENLFGRDVDLVSKRAIERSQNWIRRQNILETAQVIYVA